MSLPATALTVSIALTKSGGPVLVSLLEEKAEKDEVELAALPKDEKDVEVFIPKAVGA